MATATEWWLATATEWLATEDPVTQDPVAEDPVAEDPVAEDPVAEDPVAAWPLVVGAPTLGSRGVGGEGRTGGGGRLARTGGMLFGLALHLRFYRVPCRPPRGRPPRLVAGRHHLRLLVNPLPIREIRDSQQEGQ